MSHFQLRSWALGEDGECLRARGGRVGQGRDLPERRQGAASQVHRELGDGAADHHVIEQREFRVKPITKTQAFPNPRSKKFRPVKPKTSS